MRNLVLITAFLSPVFSLAQDAAKPDPFAWAFAHCRLRLHQQPTSKLPLPFKPSEAELVLQYQEAYLNSMSNDQTELGQAVKSYCTAYANGVVATQKQAGN